MVDVAAVAHGQQALKALEDSAALKVAVLNVKRALVSLAVEVLECPDLRCAAGERGVRLIVGHHMTVCELVLVPPRSPAQIDQAQGHPQAPAARSGARQSAAPGSD